MSNYVPGDGPLPSDVMLVGEAPGENEDRLLHPFAGKAGKELNEHYLPLAGLRRQRVYCTNVWKYRPPKNRTPTDAEVAEGLPTLLGEVAQCQPRVIAALGATAMYALMGERYDIDDYHGIPMVWPPDPRVTIVPCYHPARGLHETRFMSHLREDFETLGKVVRGELVARPWEADTNHYEVVRDIYHLPAELLSSCLIGLDTETDAAGNVWSVQVSHRPDRGYLVLVQDSGVLSRISELVGRPDTVTVMHNAKYDLAQLDRLGIHPAHVEDTMVMAYLLGKEPQGLKALVLRHLYRQRQSFEEVVASSRDAMILEWVGKVLEQEWPDPEVEYKTVKRKVKSHRGQNIAKKLERAVKDYHKGKVADLRKRLTQMDGIEDVTAVMGDVPFGSLDRIPFEEALRYAAADPADTLAIYHKLWPRIQELGLEEAYRTDINILPMIVDMERAGMPISKESLAEFSEELEHRMQMSVIRLVEHLYDIGFLAEGEWFNPNSSKEVMAYLNFLGLHPKSTEAKYVEMYAGKHEGVRHIMEYKRARKLKSTYADALPRLADKDNRVHPSLNTTRTDTGRLSSSNPNLQNQPVRTPDGQRIRAAFVAPPGQVFLSVDQGQIEMRIPAHLSNDKNMVEVFINNEDLHRFTAARAYRISEDAVTYSQRYAMKRTGFGVLYGISAKGLLELFEGEGITGYTEQDCQMFIDDWFGVFPGIETMMQAFEHEARTTGMIRDMFGRIRLVPEVYSAHFWLQKAGVRQACNAPIQSAAQVIIKKAMAALTPFYKMFDQRHDVCMPVMQIHDEILVLVSEHLVDQVAPIVRSVMENIVKLNVPLKCDVEVGYNWRDLTKWKPRQQQ